MTKIEITYNDGTDEIRRFDTDDEAIEFLRLCEVRYQRERSEPEDLIGTCIATFQILP